MTEISEWDNRLRARNLRIAALLSLGRESEVDELPPLASPQRAQSVESTRGESVAAPATVAGTGLNAMVEMIGRFKWLDRSRNLAVIVPDDGSAPVPAKLPNNYPTTGGQFSDGQRVRFDVRLSELGTSRTRLSR